MKGIGSDDLPRYHEDSSTGESDMYRVQDESGSWPSQSEWIRGQEKATCYLVGEYKTSELLLSQESNHKNVATS
jgi:hypothetical protein